MSTDAMAIAMCENGISGAATIARALGVSERLGAELADAAHRRRHGPGEVVWFPGDDANAVVVVTRGTLLSVNVTPSGTTVVLDAHGPDDVVGAAEAISADRRRVTMLVASGDVTTLRISLRVDALAGETGMSMIRALATLAARSHQRMTNRVTELSLPRAQDRVAAALRRLARNGEVRASQETVALVANVSRPTANRILTELAARGDIRRERMSIGLNPSHERTSTLRALPTTVRIA